MTSLNLEEKISQLEQELKDSTLTLEAKIVQSTKNAQEAKEREDGDRTREEAAEKQKQWR